MSFLDTPSPELQRATDDFVDAFNKNPLIGIPFLSDVQKSAAELCLLQPDANATAEQMGQAWTRAIKAEIQKLDGEPK